MFPPSSQNPTHSTIYPVILWNKLQCIYFIAKHLIFVIQSLHNKPYHLFQYTNPEILMSQKEYTKHVIL